MARSVCRGCGADVPPGTGTCPNCGTADPLATGAEETRPTGVYDPGTPSPAAPVEPTRPGSRLKDAAKAVGCLIIAVVVLFIALMAGLFDFLF